MGREQRLHPSLAAAQAKGYALHYRLPGMEDHFGSGELLSAGEAAALQARIARVARLEHLIDVLETFNGSTFVSVQDLGVVRGNGQVVNTRSETDPALGLVSTHLYLQLADQQATLLEQSYDALKQSLYDGLVLQTRLKPYLDAVSLNIDATGIHADFSALDSRLAAEYLADKPQAFVDRFELIQYAGQGLRAMGWSGEQTLAHWIAQAEAAGDWATIRAAMGSHFTATPTTGNDIYLGTSAGESLDGRGGNDHLVGAGGKDSLWGSDGDDTLDGGTGDDKLYGGAGSDVYAFGRGSGFDWIASDSAANAAGDAIHLAAGITAGDVEGDVLDPGQYPSLGMV